MALTDDEEKALRGELDALKKQLAETQEGIKQQKLEGDEEKRAKLAKEKPSQPKIDPDTLKDIADMKARIEKIESMIGAKESSKKKDGGFFNLFGG